MKTYKLFNLILALVFAFSLLGTPALVSADEPNPIIFADPSEDWVNSSGWPEGTEVILTINGSRTYTTVVGPSYSDPNWIIAGFTLRDYDLVAGDELSMAGGGLSASMTVSNLRVTGIDVGTSTISGTADAGSSVHVYIFDGQDQAATTEGDGVWTAVFPPDALVVGAEGSATQSDAAGNSTQISWHTLNPWIQAFVDYNNVSANDWPLGTEVTMTINGLQAGSGLVGPSAWDPYGTSYNFQLGDLDLIAGDEISMTGAGHTRTMTVSALEVTNIDVDSATVSGMADADKSVHVWVDGGSDFSIMPEVGGGWSADFSPFVFGPETRGGAQQQDEDGNYTQIDWGEPTPPPPDDPLIFIMGNPPTSEFSVISWPLETVAHIRILDSSGGTRFDSLLEATGTDDCGFFHGGCAHYHLPDNMTLEPLDTLIAAADGQVTLHHVVADVRVTSVNIETNTISGTVSPPRPPEHFYPLVFDTECNGTGENQATFDEHGNWSWDLSDVCDLTPGSWGPVHYNPVYYVDGDLYAGWQLSSWRVLNAGLSVHPDDDWLEGYDWPAGVTVNISIERSTTPASPDFTGSAVTGASDWNPSENYFSLGLWDPYFDVQAGDLVVAESGSIRKELRVSNLVVTGVDPAEDTVSGVANLNAHLQVDVFSDNATSLNIETGSDTHWTADFTGSYDLRPGDGGRVQEYDEDGDSTGDDWRVLNPNITAYPAEDIVVGEDFPAGAEVTLTINDPKNGAGTDVTLEGVANQTGGRCTGWCVEFQMPGDFQLAGGQVITLDDGTTQITYTVSNLAVTYIDIQNDVVGGTADPFSTIDLVMWFRPPNRHVTADADGNWQANFSVAGPEPDEQDTCDFSTDSLCDGMAVQADEQGRTRIDWDARNPWFYVWLNPTDGSLWDIHGYDWAPNVPVTMTLDDPATTESPDYTRTAYMEVPPWGGREQLVFNIDGMTAHPMDVVTMSQGDTTLTHTITSLRFSSIDAANDTVRGTAEPGSQVSVGIEGYDVGRIVLTDEVGTWTADFSAAGDQGEPPFDLRPGMKVQIAQENGGGTTAYGVELPNPTITVRTIENEVHANDWMPIGQTLLLEIDDPSTPESPDFTASQPAAAADWDPNQSWTRFTLGDFRLQPGFTVTMSAGSITKTHVVTNQVVTQMDSQTDTVGGTSAPNAEVWVDVWDTNVTRRVEADASGDWVADFSVPGDEDWEDQTIDIEPSTQGEARIQDADDDSTAVTWSVEVPVCQPGDTVTGTVFEHDGITPVPFAKIQIDDYNTGGILFTSTADENGTFACQLPNGEYRILAYTEDGSYTQEYYNEAGDANATLLQVAEGVHFADINFTIMPAPPIEHLTFNLQNLILQDPDVRKAIALGTDRQRILDEAFLPNGIYGMVANSIVVPEHWASAPASELELSPFDPAEAGSILEGAGWIDRDSDGFRENAAGVEMAFTFKTNNTPFRRASGEIFRENMADIGIRINAVYLPLGEILGQRDFDIAEFAWAGCTDNEPCLDVYVSVSPQNYAGYGNAAYDAAIASARAAAGDPGKLLYLIQAQKILAHDLPILPLFTRYQVAPVITEAGSDISVSPETYLEIHFAEVTTEGVTGAIATDIDPADLPANFQLLGQVYDVGTSATFTNAQVCFTYDDTGLTPAEESGIRLFHLEDNAWMDVTDDGFPDQDGNMVCGTVSSFSPFAILYTYAPNVPPSGVVITAPVGPQGISDYVTVTVDFNDPDPDDDHDVVVEWGDGTSSDSSVTGTSAIAVHQYQSPGVYTLTATVTDESGASATGTAQVTISQQLTALGPAKVWIGLKNSDDVGTKFDLLAEVYQNSTLIGTGQLDKVVGGSSGFNNAKLDQIPLTLFAPIDWTAGSTLSFKLYVRNTCYGNTHNSGTARLWYNDGSANSQFGATIGGVSLDYFLRYGFSLSNLVGSGPRKTIDVAAGSPCSAFKLLGTWSIMP